MFFFIRVDSLIHLSAQSPSWSGPEQGPVLTGSGPEQGPVLNRVPFWSGSRPEQGLVRCYLLLVEPAEGEDVFGSVSVVQIILLVRLNLQQ